MYLLMCIFIIYLFLGENSEDEDIVSVKPKKKVGIKGQT